MRKKLWLLLVLAVLVVLMVAPNTGLAQHGDGDRDRKPEHHDRDRGPSCHQKCDRAYHCERRCDGKGKHKHKKCMHECQKDKQHCENKCEREGHRR